MAAIAPGRASGRSSGPPGSKRGHDDEPAPGPLGGSPALFGELGLGYEHRRVQALDTSSELARSEPRSQRRYRALTARSSHDQR